MSMGKCKLIKFVLVGDLDQTVSLLNTHGLADHVVSMQHVVDRVVTVFKVPNEDVPTVWRKLGRDPMLCPVQFKG